MVYLSIRQSILELEVRDKSYSANTLNMENLWESQFQVATFFEMTPDLICIAGKDGFFKKANEAVINKLEYDSV